MKGREPQQVVVAVLEHFVEHGINLPAARDAVIDAQLFMEEPVCYS